MRRERHGSAVDARQFLPGRIEIDLPRACRRNRAFGRVLFPVALTSRSLLRRGWRRDYQSRGLSVAQRVPRGAGSPASIFRMPWSVQRSEESKVSIMMSLPNAWILRYAQDDLHTLSREQGRVFKTHHTPSLRATPLQRGPQSTPTKIPSGEGCPQGGVWLGSRFPLQFSAVVFCKHAQARAHKYARSFRNPSGGRVPPGGALP